jgi:hypothetical protein
MFLETANGLGGVEADRFGELKKLHHVDAGFRAQRVGRLAEADEGSIVASPSGE